MNQHISLQFVIPLHVEVHAHSFEVPLWNISSFEDPLDSRKTHTGKSDSLPHILMISQGILLSTNQSQLSTL